MRASDRVHHVAGCLSGSLGYIFSDLEQAARAPDVSTPLLSKTLTRAAQLGFTEPDARDDLSGLCPGLENAGPGTGGQVVL